MEKRFHTIRKPHRTPSADMVFGIQSVTETLRSGKEIERLLIHRELGMSDIQKLATELGIPYQKVPVEKLNRLTRKNHQGVICFVSPIRYAPLDNVMPQIYEEGQTPFLLMLDRVTDVRNFGAIARTAECAGVQAIVVPAKGGAQINADAMKTSSGALNYISVCRENSLRDAAKFLTESGLQVVACTEKATDSIYDVDFTHPTVIVMGSEEDGISPELMNMVDRQVRIPLIGKVDSLNVSAAAAVILYEAVRQKEAEKN
jgi:23S rRNA (guanosine2251-2'-O)-methyltransferase